MLQETSYWLIAFALIALAFWALARENARQRRRSARDFEGDLVNTKNSLMRAGLVELDRFLGETKQRTAAVEYLKDEEQGQTEAGGKDDNAGRTEVTEQAE